MVSLYFGLPRSGKTTMLVREAIKAHKSGKYKNIYANIHIDLPYVTYVKNDYIGIYDMRNGLILIDEGTLFADSRDYKGFSKQLVAFFMLHGHYKLDIKIFTQQWDGVDKKIRVITDKVYYVYKTPLLGHWITKYYRVPYGILIPDKKKSDSEKYGEIIQGYCKPTFLQRITQGGFFVRKKYYKYFDSWDAPVLPPLPNDNERAETTP